MKKLALALMCLVSVAFFASCTKPVENPEPSIAVMTGENYVTGTVENPTIIDATDANALNYKIGFHVESNAQTKKELSSLKITFTSIDADGTYSLDTIIDLSGKTSYDYSELLFPQDDREIYLEATVTALVTDVDNKTNTASVAFKLDIPAQPLISKTISWVRRGSTNQSAEEMEKYGLQWTGTYKAPFATLRPIDDAKLYVCDGDDFATITTDLEKALYLSNLIETGNAVDSYRNIDANASADYNDMLAVVNGDDFNVILIKHATIESIPSVGTQITITGEAK